MPQNIHPLIRGLSSRSVMILLLSLSLSCQREGDLQADHSLDTAPSAQQEGQEQAETSDPCVGRSICKEEGACVSIDRKRADQLSSHLWSQLSVREARREGVPIELRGPAPQTLCAAVTDANCQESRGCRLFGNCSAAQGICLPLRDEDCAKSTLCQHLQSCFAAPNGGGCVKREQQPGSDESSKESELSSTPLENCRQEEDCKKYGRCSLLNGRCVALSVRDCRQGLICKRFGRCRPSAYQCQR